MNDYHPNGTATLPRDFRFHHDEPRTPEPTGQREVPEQPSPPRPARLRVRRRIASSFQAPTQQFLASVAAADIPIPTIEEPQGAQDFEMPDREPLSIQTSGFLAAVGNNFRLGSLPKTPAPESASLEGQGRPNWSAASTPCDYFPRASSSFSNHSDFSDDSFYSGSRASRHSEDGSCTSPESDMDDPFVFPAAPKKPKTTSRDQPPLKLSASKLLSKSRNAPWTKAQSAHLWATYMVYLSDPTVTPFRIGASTIPPQGIVHRVAREAKRSWKGPKLPMGTIRRSTRLYPYEKSSSVTPIAEGPKNYSQWPHSSNATRTHLRELCKTKDSNPVQRHHHLQSRSPTPFSKPYFRESRMETPRLSSSFNTTDIALSLATSTSESMQPDGPLAQLCAKNDITSIKTSTFPPLNDFLPTVFGPRSIFEDGVRGRKLGSPFTARTYGPSSSKLENLYRPISPRTHSDTAIEPQLGSPVRFDQPRSLNTTMKRRAQNSLDEELSPDGAVLRPSILNDQLFGGSQGVSQESRRRVRSRGFSLGDEAFHHRNPGLFQRFPILPALSTALESPVVPLELTTAPTETPKLLPSVTFDPPRLGSPFSESGPSQTFPRRLFQDASATIRRSQFATMHQTRRSIESFDFGEGPSLQSRLAHLDDKLKEIREREPAPRRH